MPHPTKRQTHSSTGTTCPPIPTNTHTNNGKEDMVRTKYTTWNHLDEQGRCTRHPTTTTVPLPGTHPSVVESSSCPMCDEDLRNELHSLHAQRTNVTQQLADLELETTTTHNPRFSTAAAAAAAEEDNPSLSLESLGQQMSRMQQMQDWLLVQKETEMEALRRRVKEQQEQLTRKEEEMVLLREKLLVQQESNMQQQGCGCSCSCGSNSNINSINQSAIADPAVEILREKVDGVILSWMDDKDKDSGNDDDKENDNENDDDKETDNENDDKDSDNDNNDDKDSDNDNNDDKDNDNDDDNGNGNDNDDKDNDNDDNGNDDDKDKDKDNNHDNDNGKERQELKTNSNATTTETEREIMDSNNEKDNVHVEGEPFAEMEPVEVTTKVDEESEAESGDSLAVNAHGNDRQKVVRKDVLDPYGDSGNYTGVLLLTTGMPHGLGSMVYKDDGRAYEGDWRHGRWHGFGRATFANGDSYEGEYQFDQRHGRGLYQWADGRTYDGAFHEDKRHGQGSFQWPDGATFEGNFVKGQREGHGWYKFSDGGCYIGDWVDGRYEGFGECVWADGRVYKGNWVQGMAHGQGVETDTNGDIRHEGQWREDEPISEV